jgi:hypothetical protein
VCVCVRVYFFPTAQQPLLGLGLLVIEALRSHTHTHHSVGLIWTSDQPIETTSTGRQHSKEKYSRFEPAIPTTERPQTHALDRAANGIDMFLLMYVRMNTLCVCMYQRMSALCMRVRVYVITYLFSDVKLPTNDRKETSESP